MKLYLPSIAAVLLLGAASPAFAIALAPSPTASKAAATQAQHLAAIKTRGNADIDQRVASLNGLIVKTGKAVRLSASQKAELTADMQQQVTSLASLKASLGGETDVEAAKSDFQSIFSAHYVYAFYFPRTERILAADDLSDAANRLSGLTGIMQGYMDQAKAAGKDTGSLQVRLDDMTTKAADAQSQSTAAIASLTALSASGYPGNKAAITAAAGQIKNVRGELDTAQGDAKAVRDGLKAMLEPHK